MRNGFLIAAALTILGSGAENVNYDTVRQGHLPPGWSSPSDREWGVRSDKTAPSRPNVLQGGSGAAGESEPPLAVFDKVVCRDADLSVKFRIGAGQSGNPRGNAAGIVWRYRDPGNYYLLSLSADDRNIVLQRVQNGVASVIPADGGKPGAVGVAEDIRPGQWHVVKVSFRGPKVQVFFGNRSLFTAQDSGILTAGKTGLWAKGADGAAFDDFRIDKKG
jgi:hypothetical protein